VLSSRGFPPLPIAKRVLQKPSGLASLPRATVIAVGIAAIGAVAVGMVAVQMLALGGDADVNRKIPRAQGSSAFLSLLDHFPQDPRVGDDVVWLRFSDYARARRLLDLDSPKQDAGRSDIQQYAGALAGTGIPGYLVNTWGLGSRSDEWNNELGFNLTNIDQSLELHIEHRSEPPPEVALHGRFDAGPGNRGRSDEVVVQR
jgi:hypothetical protein